VKIIALIMVALLATSCSGNSQSQQQSFQIVPPKDASLHTKALAMLPKLTKACPGLNDYAGDLSPATVSESQMSGYEGGITLAFQVSSHPKQLPPPLDVRSAGHNCYIEINADGSRAYIGKSACSSISDGSWQENSPGLMGREFEL